VVVDNVTPIQTRTEFGDPPVPVVKGGLDVLPEDTNASGGAGIFDHFGGANHSGTATYELEFTTPATYYLYVHASIYNSDANTSYGNEDSFFLPPAFNMNSSTDWIGFEGIDYTTGDPKTGDSAVDGWEPVFNSKEVMSAGVIEVHNDTNEDFWDGTFHWMHAAFVIDSNADGGYISDFGFAVRYEVTESDAGQVLTFQISSREPYGAWDQFIFSTNDSLLQDFTQAQMDHLFNGTVGDMDFDYDVDFDDIDDFVLGLNDPALYITVNGLPSSVNGDADNDGDQDFDDIAGFVAALSSGGAAAVPEPATWSLLLGTAGMVFVTRLRRKS
jgi:hypothetical protein